MARPRLAGGRSRLGAVALTIVLGALALAGCGLGAGTRAERRAADGHARLRRDDLRSWSAPQVSGQETVMSLLMRNATVEHPLRRRLRAEHRRALGRPANGGQPIDWFYYVNGVEAPQGAAATNVHPGDRIWWDRHDWSQTDGVPAVVGSFPEPFLNGLDGKRLPVRVECAGRVRRRLPHRRRAAARARRARGGRALGSGGGASHTLRVVVGAVGGDRGDPSVQTHRARPAARAASTRASPPTARRSRCSTRTGSATHTLGAGAGLVAATRSGEDAPVWVVTGTDAAGVQRGRRRVRRRRLRRSLRARRRRRGGPFALPAGES